MNYDDQDIRQTAALLRQSADELTSLREQLAAAQAQLSRYTSGVMCPNCDKLRLELWEERAISEAAHMTDETGWVIEGAWSSPASPDYWCGSSAWSSDHMSALRFARRADAQQAADLMLAGVNVRICEHAWSAEPRT